MKAVRLSRKAHNDQHRLALVSTRVFQKLGQKGSIVPRHLQSHCPRGRARKQCCGCLEAQLEQPEKVKRLANAKRLTRLVHDLVDPVVGKGL